MLHCTVWLLRADCVSLGQTPMMLARSGAVVELLVNAKAQVNAVSRDNKVLRSLHA